MDSFVFSSFLSFSYGHVYPFFFLCVRRNIGSRSIGIPHYNRASWFRVGKGFFIYNPVIAAQGAAAQPLP